MRERPEGYSNVIAVQWLCAAVEQFIGTNDLADTPGFLSGFSSITDHPSLSSFARAAFSLRQLGVSYTSENELRQAVYDFLTWEEMRREEDNNYVDQPYNIDPRSRRITFVRRAGNDPRIEKWAQALERGVPIRLHGMSPASEGRSMGVDPREAGARRITVDLAEAAEHLPERPYHNISARERSPVLIPLADLQAIAERFDAIDAADANRTSKAWSRRLLDANGAAKVEVLTPAANRSRLEPADTITLDGLKHMIGLPGTGKTTLVTLIIAWLYERKLRTVVLLPSIEVSFNLMADLSGYGVDVGLLMGQSPDTRLNHARKLAERIGSLDNARGFGRTVPFADLMSVNCALAGFDDRHDDEQPFPHLDPPCTRISQAKLKADGTPRDKESTSFCPVSSWCGRMKAARQLAERHVWLGHVMSLDTRMPPHFAEEHIRHIEAVARASDVVIADEVDGIQSVLDGRAVGEITISGAKSSYENRLLDDLLKPIALGENDRTGTNVADYASKATRFIDLNRFLVRLLQNDRAASGNRFFASYDDAFVTGNRVVADLFGDPAKSHGTDAERSAEDERVGAIMAFWDACIRQVLFRTLDTADGEERDFDIRRTGITLSKSDEEVQEAFRKIADFLQDWLSYPSSVQKADAIEQAREAMMAFVSPNPELGMARSAALFTFLVNVSSVVMQFLSLLPAQHVMAAEGVHRSPIFVDGISMDFGRLVPDSIIGRLAGVRFLFQQRRGRNSLQLHYVTFEGAPRMLLYRFHELLRHDGIKRGPNVLLTSATSFLADSPAFHVPVGPDYILRRADSDTAWKESRYLLKTVPDPQNPKKALRFSGAPYEDRERIMRAMTNHFVREGGLLQSLLADSFAKGRKVAFVVNGYEQVRLVKDHAMSVSERNGRRLIAVVNAVPEGNMGDYVTAAQVERLGERDDWDAVVFPMKALSRGVNIVFGGPLYAGMDLADKAAIGTVAFLTRPHPAQESFDFVAGMVGRSSMEFDHERFGRDVDPRELAERLRTIRRQTMTDVRRLLRHSVRFGTLGNLNEAFVADVMIDVIQTIGRSMRNGCKTRVLFVDAAWAPNSTRPEGPSEDTAATSYLVAMQRILDRLVNSKDAVHAEIYEALYRPYLEPLSQCQGLLVKGNDGQ
ncbi:hypothetical protein [Mesorhizobium sp. M0276]|uniref:pPIWI_RE_Z domain-containing protein n=2 Tax=unclassified Mesorhizobium TaxID=325217 RepID=UPI003339A896